MTPNLSLKTDIFGFPSHQISPAEKNEKWHLAYMKAFHKEYTLGGGKILRYAYADYEKYRMYATGKQPIDQYKAMLGTVKNKGKKDISWRNLDWNILPILPTLVAMVKNKVLGQKKDVLIKAVDKMSVSAETERKNQILTYLTNLKLMQRANQEFGVPIESPLEDGAPIPGNMQELELHMQMYPKDRYIMELHDHFERVKLLNNWGQIWDDVVGDLVEVGVGGTKCWIDVTGVIRCRRVIPERVITNNCNNPDFSDMTRIAEYTPMSISELRSMVPRGTFTEEDYAKMASTASGKNYNVLGNDNFFRTNFRYPYDHEKIMVLDAEWFSADDYAYVVEKTNTGNVSMEKKQDPHWLGKVQTDRGVGVSDAEYMERHPDKQIIRDSVNNLYGAMWVVGTHYIFNWGLKHNIQRSVNYLGDCKSNYNLYTFFDSFIRRAEPVADQIQINWLQHQHHASQSKPSGLKINKRALTTLTVGGKGGMQIELDELDLLRMYTETGSIVYKTEDAAGRPYPFDPVQELKGGLNEAAFQHFELIRGHIDLLRTIFGLNEATDSSTPNPKLGKAIAEMLEQNTNTALGTVYHAYSKLYENTVKSIASMIPDAELIKSQAKDEGLGESSGDFFRANAGATWRELAISITDGPTTEVRNTLRKYIENAQVNKEIFAEDAHVIEIEENIMRAYHMLAQARKKKAEHDRRVMQDNYAMEETKNINSANAAEQAKVNGARMVAMVEMEKEMKLMPLKERLLAMELQGKLLLEKMKIDGKLEQTEREMLGRYLETLEKVAGQERVAEENRRAAAARPAARQSA